MTFAGPQTTAKSVKGHVLNLLFGKGKAKAGYQHVRRGAPRPGERRGSAGSIRPPGRGRTGAQQIRVVRNLWLFKQEMKSIFETLVFSIYLRRSLLQHSSCEYGRVGNVDRVQQTECNTAGWRILGWHHLHGVAVVHEEGRCNAGPVSYVKCRGPLNRCPERHILDERSGDSSGRSSGNRHHCEAHAGERARDCQGRGSIDSASRRGHMAPPHSEP